MLTYSRWRSVERFDPWKNFNQTKDFGLEFLLSQSKEFCESQGTLLNIFDPYSTIIMKLVKVILRKTEAVRLSYK